MKRAIYTATNCAAADATALIWKDQISNEVITVAARDRIFAVSLNAASAEAIDFVLNRAADDDGLMFEAKTSDAGTVGHYWGDSSPMPFAQGFATTITNNHATENIIVRMTGFIEIGR